MTGTNYITHILTITAVAAGITLGMAVPASADTVIVEHTFDGTGLALNGVDVVSAGGTFDAAIVIAGGSATWVADAGFLDNGAVSVTRKAAYLNLGSYIDDAKGTAAGKFVLTYTVSPTTGSWISYGFSTLNAPATGNDFTQAAQSGIATIIYRNTGELDMFIGPQTAGSTDGPDGNSGSRTLTVTVDFTPAGGYDGVSNFGTVTWTDSALGSVNNLGTPFALPNQNFGSILISGATGPATGTISDLTLTQVQYPDMRVLHGGAEIPVNATNALPNTTSGSATTREYVVTNLASAATNLYLTDTPAVVFSENGQTNYNGFTLVTNITGAATNLAAGATAAFAVRFVTNVVGSYTATVSIANNDTSRNPYTFKVTAQVIAALEAIMEVYDGGTLVAPEATHSFGGVATGATKSKAFTITNLISATDMLHLTADPVVVFSENGLTNCNGFTITPNIAGPATNLAIGASTQFGVEFTTGVAGSYTATVSIANSDADRNPYQFKVTATSAVPGVARLSGARRVAAAIDMTTLTDVLLANGDWAIWEGAHTETSTYDPTDRKSGGAGLIGHLTKSGSATGISGSTTAWGPGINWTDGTTVAVRAAAPIYGGGVVRPLDTVGASLTVEVSAAANGANRAYFWVGVQNGAARFRAALPGASDYVATNAWANWIIGTGGTLYVVDFTPGNPASDKLTVTYELIADTGADANVRLGAVAVGKRPPMTVFAFR